MSLYRVSINYCYNFKNSPQSDFLRYFQLVCFMVKGNASSLRRCFSILLHLHHQSHVGYPIDIQFLAIHSNCIKCFNYLLLQITNVSDFGSVNDILYIAPQEKIQWCDIRGTWRPWNGTITSNPSFWKCVIQQLTNCKTPMKGCTVLLENN